MDYVALGHSGIEVSRICIGGMSFGEPDPANHEWTVDADSTHRIIEYAFDRGINYIDTANCYAHGTSEEFIGRALKRAGIPRENIVLQSKVFFNEGGLSKDAIHREIDASLRRLDTDYLDVYMIHRFDYETPIEETMEALDDLVRSGKVRALGASEMFAYQLHNMQIAAQSNGWERFSNMQCHYNLLYRENEREMIPVCRQFGMAITPYSPLASGHLARKDWDSESLRSRTDLTMADKYDRSKALDLPIIERLVQLSEKRGVPMAQVAIAWHLCKGIESPTLGFSSTKRVDDALEAVDLKLSAEEIAFLEEPYLAHELVGPIGRPGEKPIAGTVRPKEHDASHDSHE